MIEKQIDLRFLDARNDLIKFINDIPKKYGLSFIFIDQILNDIKNQVEKSAINDFNALIAMNQNKENKQKEDLLTALKDSGIEFSDDVEIDIKESIDEEKSENE